MPVQRCTKNGKSGWRWGKSGKCYIGIGAKAKAAKQGAAIKASGYQEQDINMRSTKMLFQKITTNFTGVVRNDTMEGRDYLVAPMIMIVEGVHDGSNGPLYYPADELSKIPAIWNHKPIIVYHPEVNGEGVSACDPQILTNRKVGVIMNTTVGEVEVEIDDKKVKVTGLKAEAWLEIERMNTVDERVADAVEKNEMMELSTGVYTDNEDVEGEWNGEPYVAIARNYRPDHLALLPDKIGACSIEDGAGFLRLNEQKNTISLDLSVLKNPKAVECLKNNGEGLLHSIQNFVNNEISFDDTRQRLQSKLRTNLPEDDFVWIEDVFDDYFVYERLGVLYKQEYDDVDGSISFKGIPNVVVKQTNYIVKNKRKDRIMKKKEKLVKALIENKGTNWGEDDKEDLMEFDEEILNKMTPVENKKEDDNKDKDKDKDKATENKITENKATENKQDDKDKATKNKGEKDNKEETVENMTAEQYIDKKVPPELKDVLRNGLASYNAGKARLVEVITTNKKNTFTKEQLEAKDLDELKSLASLAANTDEQKEQVETFNYAGQGDPNHNDTEEEPLEMPAMNFERKSA